MKHRVGWAIACAMPLAVAPAAKATTFFVDGFADGGNGTTWAFAFKTLQEGLQAARDDDENLPHTIKVAGAYDVFDGIYHPHEGLGLACDHADARLATFGLVRQTKIVGGYRVQQGEEIARNPVVYHTILSGDLCEDDETEIVDWNSYVVVTGVVGSGDPDGTLALARTNSGLDGVFVEAGRANGNDANDKRAGGIVIATEAGEEVGASPLIFDSVIRKNIGVVGGGDAELGGGAIAVYTDPQAESEEEERSAPWLRDLLVEDNEAENGRGGGIWSFESLPVILTSVIRNNTADGYGGGVDVSGDAVAEGLSHAEMRNCEITGNSADQGGGIAMVDARLQIVNSLVTENAATGTAAHGGGLHTLDSTIAVINCTIATNTARAHGAGAAINGSGGLFEFPLGDPELSSIRNSILWGNRTTDPEPDGPEQIYTNLADNEDLTIAKCDVEQGNSIGIYVEEDSQAPTYTSNIQSDPLFRESPSDYRLEVGSGARNTGDDSRVPDDGFDVDQDFDDDEPTPDLDLSLRIFLGVDMGAYESTCYADFDGNDEVGFSDLVSVLLSWGDCPPGPCPTDLNNDDHVGFFELTAVLINWGACGEAEEPATLAEALEAAGLSMEDWEDFEDVMQEGTTEEKLNHDCWFKHFTGTLCWPECDDPGCPDVDPFDHDI